MRNKASELSREESDRLWALMPEYWKKWQAQFAEPLLLILLKLTSEKQAESM